MKKESFAQSAPEVQLRTLVESPVGQALGLTEKFIAQAVADQGRAKLFFKASGMALWRKEAIAAKESKAFPFLYRWVQLEKAFFAFESAKDAFGDGR